MSNTAAPIQGTVATGWEKVRDTFVRNLEFNGDHGAGVAVYHRGELVVDLVGGWFDKNKTVEYSHDSLQVGFSMTKGIIAIAIAMLVDRGLIDYSAPVAQYWPEFDQHGKGEATVAQLLSHQCGLYTVDGEISLEECLDWVTITERLAATRPAWPIGTATGYHALTYGWLAGELIRRVDGRSPGRFVRDEIGGPLGAEIYIGLPAELESRVSRLVARTVVEPAEPMTDEQKTRLIEAFAPDGKGTNALSVNGAFGNGAFNRPEVHQAEVPGGNGITNARSMARMYSATFRPMDGVQLLSPSVREVLRTRQTPEGAWDLCLGVQHGFGMGMFVSNPHRPMTGHGSFGHSGAGGSIAFAHPERDVSFCYIMNAMAAQLGGDTRASSLITAVDECLTSF
jgi:CubicO group peptidase (beta-lactamase class C family)